MAKGRRCFVTIGATASFSALLEEVLTKEFVAHLRAKNFSELLVQTGPDQDWALDRIKHIRQEEYEQGTNATEWPYIEAFSYTTDVSSKMLPCRGNPGDRPPGVIISHAGSGSILDATRMDVPLIVVSNPALLGNHQEELADAVQDAGWAVKGKLGNLHDAIDRAVLVADKQAALYSAMCREPGFPPPAEERSGLFEWMETAANWNDSLDETESLQID